MKRFASATTIVMLALAVPAMAASDNLTAPGANDIHLTGPDGLAISSGRIDVFQDAGSTYFLDYRATATNSYYEETAHALTLHGSDGSFIRTLATDTQVAYANFVRLSGSTVYVGVGDDIESVSLGASGGELAHVATLGNNFAMTFSGTSAYAVANPGWAGNKIYKVDLSGGDDHTVVADVGGYSAGLAFDSVGNLYYGTNGLPAFGLGSDRLLAFTPQQVAAGGLAVSDATVLSDLPMGAGGVAVDEGGNILLTMNKYGSLGELAIVRADKDYSSYDGYRFDVLSGVGNWCTDVDAIGSVVDYIGGVDNAVFVAGGGELSYVPEPFTLAMMIAGGLTMLVRRRAR